MRSYFIHDGMAQQGPFTLEELKAMKLSSDTSIWYEGLSEWTHLGAVQELRGMVTPPPFTAVGSNTYGTNQPPQTPKKNKRTFLKVLLILFVFMVVVVVGLLAVAEMDIEGIDGGTKSQAQIEREQPSRFLKASGVYTENLWGDKLELDLTVANKSQVTSYKDIQVEVSYLSKTGSVVGSEVVTVYEYLEPNFSKTLEVKVPAYEDAVDISLRVIDAIAL
jgi:hypothetical protein